MIAALIVVAGVGAVWSTLQDRRRFERAAKQDGHDIERANAPLIQVSVDAWRRDPGQVFVVSVPIDQQWQRIVRRLGAPQFVIMVGSDLASSHPEVYAANDVGLTAHVTISGEPQSLTETPNAPYRYSWGPPRSTLGFSASPGDVIRMSVNLTKTVPSGAFVTVYPLWNHLELWDWTDGLAMGTGLVELVSPVILAVGVVVIVVGCLVGLWPLRPTR